jgi:hypothetical protein
MQTQQEEEDLDRALGLADEENQDILEDNDVA